jgi:aspartate/methionine/tyrosine aminotransferase
VIIASPANPTGTIIPASELAAIADVPGAASASSRTRSITG